MTRRSPLSALALVVVAAPACYTTEDAFIRRLAKLSCVNARECEPEAFEQAFDSMSDCRDAAEDQAQSEFAAFLDGNCEYVPAAGRSCIHALYHARKNCDVEEADLADCKGVFACPGGLELESPTMPTVLQSLPD